MKILLISEFTYLNTGYATYYKQLAEAIHFDSEHEVVELACYGNPNDKKHVAAASKIPWKIFFNVPKKSEKEAWEAYHSRENAMNDAKHGAWIYEQILLAEKPDIVIALRDFWYDKFILDSPLSKYVTNILSPTVDGMPQQPSWIDGFNRADILTTYNEWSEDWLKTQCNFKNLVPCISPGDNKNFCIRDRNECRKALGLEVKEGQKVVGTIMRNQFRKLYPKLFEAVSKVDNLILYCHTGYPDKGWELSEDILKHNIHDRVYLTYKCTGCGQIRARLFSDRHPYCKTCKHKMTTCDVQVGATESELNGIINSYDIYCQLHNSEGFGIPTLEAGQTGTRVLSTDYSAQQAVLRKIEGIPIKVMSLEKDFDTGCYKAIPDLDHLVSLFKDPKTYEYDREHIRKVTLSNYNWDATRKKWLQLIDSVKPKNLWNSQPDIQQPVEFDKVKNLDNFDFVMACILNVAYDVNLVGSFDHATMLSNLNDGSVVPKDKYGLRENKIVRVTKEDVYKKMLNHRNLINAWEDQRSQKLQKQTG